MQKYKICFLALCLISCAHAAVSSTDFNLVSLGNGIYVHHGEHLDIDTGYQGDICNISFVVGRLGVAVIDTGGSLKVGKALRAAIKKITDKPILYVINTHVHPDHIFGNAAFIEDKPVFVGHAKLGDAMQLREEAYGKLNSKYLGEEAKGSIIPTQIFP
jgi:glyoxylase-like metal-dependent hydrolase (beta-lactamase superfamily II)